jgi:hypothetical protein
MPLRYIDVKSVFPFPPTQDPSGGMSLKRNLLKTLLSEPTRWVNFIHMNRGVSPIVFYHLAAAIHNGTVKTDVDASIQGRTAFYNPQNNTIIASGHDFGSEYLDEKSLLIHESAHACLDAIYAGKDMRGTRAPMRVIDDEITGYLAGAFYLVAANAAGASSFGPEREAIKVARSKLKNPRPIWDGCLTFTFSSPELGPLRNAIMADPMYRNEWRATAVHNG